MPEHIKIPNTTPIVRYSASGSDDTFEYAFPIFASEDLAVYLDGAKQASGFTINGAGNTSGGSVVFDTAPTSGTIVTLSRELPIERITDYLEGGSFSAASINSELDYIIAAIRTSHDKFSDLISIKDFGAVGDGISWRPQKVMPRKKMCARWRIVWWSICLGLRRSWMRLRLRPRRWIVERVDILLSFQAW